MPTMAVPGTISKAKITYRTIASVAYALLTDILLVLVPVVVGTGLIIKSAFERHKHKMNKYEY